MFQNRQSPLAAVSTACRTVAFLTRVITGEPRARHNSVGAWDSTKWRGFSISSRYRCGSSCGGRWAASGVLNRRHGFGFRLSWRFFTILVNGGLGLTYTGVGDTAYEESRFGFIDSRARLGIDAAAAAVIVATIVYGLTIKRLPKAFLRFVIAAFVALLGITAPILWVPIELPELFFLLRHIQTIAMNFALFWIVAALIVMLRDMFEHSELIVKGKGHDGDEFSSEKKTSDRAG